MEPMRHSLTHTDLLVRRLEDAQQAVTQLAAAEAKLDQPHNLIEAARLEGKRQGLQVAASYVNEHLTIEGNTHGRA